MAAFVSSVRTDPELFQNGDFHMAVLLSTNMFRPDALSEALSYVNELDGAIGIELFPFFDDPAFEPLLENCLPGLKNLEISFHEPYRKADHTFPEGTAEYEQTMKMERQTAEYAGKLGAHYVVCHHNNVKVPENDPKKLLFMRDQACLNLRRVEHIFSDVNVPVLVENVGVHSHGNVLYEQKAFTELCERRNYRVLIDIGHANANGWDLFGLMRDLRDRIASYHLHNNDGFQDSHQRIRNGSLDFEKFIEAWRQNGILTDWVVEYAPNVEPDHAGVIADLKYLLQEYHL